MLLATVRVVAEGAGTAAGVEPALEDVVTMVEAPREVVVSVSVTVSDVPDGTAV